MDPKFAEWLRGVAEKGGEFVEREAPLYAQELVAWLFWSNVLVACIAAAVMLALVVGAVMAWREVRESSSPVFVPPPLMFAAMALPTLAVVSGVVCANATFDAVKAAVAPRVVIVEHVSGK